MKEQDTILDEITRKQLIWYGHVERMDPTRLPKIMAKWKPEGRKKRGHPQRTWKDWDIYTAMSERDIRMGGWNNRRQWNMDVGRRRSACSLTSFPCDVTHFIHCPACLSISQENS
jgi:hypothetical protein